jgi:hypothetical protein
MNPKEFLSTVYLGDRSCKSILIDGWNERVLVEIDIISRVRSPSGLWNYYSQEDIQNGLIIFEGVEAITFEPPGLIPNGYVNSLTVEEVSTEKNDMKDSKFMFQLWIDSTYGCGLVEEVKVNIIAQSIHLEDPKKPGISIIT